MKTLTLLVLMLFALGNGCGVHSGGSEGNSGHREQQQAPKVETSRAVLLLIDKSGSMGNKNRLRYAKEIAKAVARGLSDDDIIGVIGFDVNTDELVALATQSNRRQTIHNQIDRLKAEGPTMLSSALAEARRQLDGVANERKHVILLSDGSTRGPLRQLVELTSAMKNESKLTVSAIAIRAEIGEIELQYLLEISRYGGGLFYYACDSSTAPRIILDYLSGGSTSFPMSDNFSQCEGPIISGSQYK